MQATTTPLRQPVQGSPNALTVRLAVAWSLLISIPSAIGCSLLQTPGTEIGSASRAFDRATIVYQQRSGPTVAPTQHPSGQAQLISYNQPASAVASGDGKIRTLSILYPHPKNKAGFARVEYVVESTDRPAEEPRSAAASWIEQARATARDCMPGVGFAEGVDEAWALDIPIAEVDRIIERLAAGGYFSPAAGGNQAGAANQNIQLSANINGSAFQRPWQPMPEFDALVARVRREGRIVSHRQRHAVAQPPGSRWNVSQLANPVPAAGAR